ncbi:hypothetical protein N865_09630 [Intrasporangium oryzae NRRL B-24470]|uniref:Uncharacterized protein n=1 Tax=Intrasporangium oryzae NRRL B-24470 TaxID=1386089 RepID=W9G622_9MICO|nr:hypothetical protein [Intrasporangium oryzae]EWT01601.1 hypothetical protein N865_09630 [Intrasporangium oryzae NRRL B-24470]
MPASSLIFVVIVAIWAAYLVQHFARRRDNAAAARTMDGFSDGMRVLETHAGAPTEEPAPARGHAHSVAPARVVRPTVDARRSVPAGPPHGHAPLLGRPGAADVPVHHEVETTPTPAPVVSMAQRRLRAVLLLLSLLWLPVSVGLALAQVIRWISVPFAALTVVAVLVWLRTEVQADRLRRARRRVQERVRRPAQAPVLSSDDTQVIRPEEVVASLADPDLVPGSVAHPATAAAGAVARAGSTAYDVFDVQAGVVEVALEQQAAVDAPGLHADGTWSPVPVPTPTYAMKAKAQPRLTESGIPADVFETPEFADEADELDDRALFARRAVSG